MNKIYNWGIIGPGKIARKFAAGLQFLPNAKLHSVASRDYARAEEFGKEFHAEKIYGSYIELVKDTELDIIYIATPHSQHYENALLCLNHGKHVLCEKAFTTNSRELFELVELAREKKLFLMEALWTRFLPSFEKVMDIVKSGQLGEIKMLHADFGFPAVYNINSRLFNPLLAGGSLLDIGIYPLFLSLMILGQPEEMNIMAVIGETGVDESLAMNFRHSNGALSVLSSTFLARTNTVADIYGTLGSISMKSRWFALTSLILRMEGLPDEEIKIEFTGNGMNYEAAEVMNCLDAGLTESPKMSLDFSLELMGLMDVIREKAGVIYPSDAL
jgi:predicted dehydrogenase